jgi:hypothetical protein
MYVAALALVFSGCKKAIEEKKEDLLVNLIVDGQWVVAKYTKGRTDVTADFSPYSFQFKRNFTVDAIHINTVETTGTWNGDINTKTIVSNFTNSNPILILLNGTWHVTDSGLTYVESTQTVNGEERFLRLVKK